MKLSLTFQSFVKPLYKEYCIQTIEKTVSQIKEHFRFQKKQNIYHTHEKYLKTDHYRNIQTSQMENLDKTVNKKIISQIHQPGVKNFHLHETIFCQNNHTNNRKETQPNLQTMNTQMCKSLSLPSQSQRQKNELIQFMNKVQTNLDCQTSFYKNLLQKIQLMGQKQKHLEYLIIQLRSLAKQKKMNYNLHLVQFDNFTSCPLSSMTFRRSQSFSNQQLPIQKITLHQSSEIKNRRGQETTCFKAQYQLKNKQLISDQSKRNIANGLEKQQNQNTEVWSHLMLENQSVSSNYFTQSKNPSEPINSFSQSKNPSEPINSFSQSKKSHRQNERQTVERSQRFLREQYDQNDISQNADFLISFLKLEQQFNKIKKKSHFTSCQSHKNTNIQGNSKFNLLSAQ